MSQSDDQGGSGAGSSGQEPTGQPPYDPQQYGQEHYGRPQYGQPQYDPQQYGQPQPGQPQYGQPQYGQPQPGQPQYGQPQYGQPEYGQPQYGQPDYGQPPAYAQQYGYVQQYGQPAYGQYGAPGVPTRPAGVTTAAVFGFVFGALGILATIVLLIIGAAAAGGASSVDQQFPGLGQLSGAVGGVVIGVGLVALAWTVLIIWGSVYALSGRSRVLLLVAGSISIFATGISFLGSIGDSQSSGGGVFLSLVFFAMAIAIVVLLAMKPAAAFYAAHRARRGR